MAPTPMFSKGPSFGAGKIAFPELDESITTPAIMLNDSLIGDAAPEKP